MENTPNSSIPAQSADSVPAKVWRHPAVFVATGFWAGRAPFAPGTFGSLLGLPLAVAISFLPGVIWQAVAIVGLVILAVPICDVAARELGQKKDPSCVVLDEIVTIPFVFFLLPHELVVQPLTLAIGFALHRLFDISKPPPASQLERLPGGLGIVADDCAAGVYGSLAMHGIIWLGWLG